ncbi:MAG TPA: Glu/Leu/Phe/Val dehydrogenase dimerization domain-containing protein [Acidimicrobiia bacterium]|nr:Glu/Leu/Phe/Val dehydrogenase dimerization domain-containing protein [Acidimicrobiia bacterium]
MGVFDEVARGGHEEVVYGYDEVSGLRAIIAIHSTALGPALGGTRFFPYQTEQDALADVLRLAKGMTYKAAAAGLDLGGGKAVIIGDPASDKSELLLRAYARLVDSLGGRYITAEDVGTTTADVDIMRRETRWALGSSIAEGGAGDPSPVTSRGLFAAARAVSEFIWGDADLAGRRFAVQGVGKVGSAFVQLLVEARADVIVADSSDEAMRIASETYGVKGVDVEDIHTVDCDIYSPCALGGGLNQETIPQLNCQAIVGSANNQLAEEEDADRIARRGIVYGPDFVVNAGGLINVHDELHGYSRMRALQRVDSIFDATKAILEISKEEGINPNQAAVIRAEDRIRHIGDLRRFRRSGEETG